MKKTIILFFGIVLLLNGAEVKSVENNSSQKEGKYLYKISKKFSLEKDGNESYMFTDIEVFNHKGQLVQDKRDSKYFTWITYYTYNANGQKIKKVSINLFKPKNNYTELYSYDEKGVLTEVQNLDDNGKVESVNKIDNSEDNSTKMEYDSNGKLIKKVVNTFDWLISLGTIDIPKEKTDYYGKKITTYQYDQAGNEIKQEFIDRYDHIDKHIYNYDKEWNLLSETNSSESNHTIIEHYVLYKEYDTHNNLTKKYTKVFKGVSGCRGGLSYSTPDYTLLFSYDKKNRVIQIDNETRCSISYRKRVFQRKYRTTIRYEYNDELRF